MKAVKPLPKRLIICCDGTWQSSVSGKHNIPSNVTRLARTIAKAGQDENGQNWQQIVYYDSGIGTGDLMMLEKLWQGGTGEGLVVNVLEAYNFLVNNYAPGDQIFCFGFSRGAFTARAIAGLVTDIGIFRPDNMQAFLSLWALYRKNTAKHNFRKTKEYFEYLYGVRPMVPKGEEEEIYTRKPWETPHRSEIDVNEPLIWPGSNVVEVVGVFDTVGCLGIADTRFTNGAPTRRRFEWLNVKLSPFINHAFHALALDERREPFTPTLWYIPSEATLKAEEAEIDDEDDQWPELKAHRDSIDIEVREYQATHPPDLYQVWFPGYHVNIGGGSDGDSADAEGLSNITFAWMVQQLGPFLAFEPWTWGELGIAGYQRRVIKEEQLYHNMKQYMTREEEKEYGELVQKNGFEHVEDAFSDLWHLIRQSGRNGLGLEGPEMVPIPEKNIRNPDLSSDVGLDGKPITVQWAASQISDSYTWGFKVVNEPETRTPGECSDRSREDGKPLRDLGQTNEYIHPAVWWRNKKLENEAEGLRYYPEAIQPVDRPGFTRQQDPKYGSWGYLKGNIWIPEWFVKPTNSYLSSKGLDRIDTAGDEAWEHAEWTYLDNVADRDELQKELAQFYIDARGARDKMKADKKEFPFEVLS